MGNRTSKDENDYKGLSRMKKEVHKTSSNTNVDQIATNARKIDKKIKRSASGTDVTESYITQLMPIQKLCEILKEKSVAEGVNGITANVFVRHVFRNYPDVGQRLFKYLHGNSKAATEHLGCVAFRQQCERFLSIMEDLKILECHIKMYAQDENPDLVDKDGIMQLLQICYTINTEQSHDNTVCPKINRTFTSVTNSIFFAHDVLSVGYVCRWFEHNLVRLILMLHKYCVHALSTSYRGLDQVQISFNMELRTPVLNHNNSSNSNFKKSNINSTELSSSTLMPTSQAWLLAAALPSLYSKPQKVSPSANGNKNFSSTNIFKEKHCIIPSHWTLLYNSNDHGLGVNRFLHHILGYRGPTLILLYLENEQTYVIAAPSEWKESTVYFGGESSCVIQILPKILILENKPNILYLNTYIRGYPKGLRVGSDPKKPIISIDEHFEYADIKGIATKLLSIEAWGCGDEISREVQLDIKKWQIKEAERQRTVKLTAADWMNHPDRFLLELGGRQSYNN